jgi:hypothetical protein
MTIVVGHHLTLNKIVEFTLKVDITTRFVASEEIANMNPYLACGGTVKMETHIHEILRNSRVERITDKEILHGLSHIVGMSIITLNVGKKVELTKHHLKESAPFYIIVDYISNV